MDTMTTSAEADDFDTAKIIFDKLKEVPVERQKRILGWVAEGLGCHSRQLHRRKFSQQWRLWDIRQH
jgi:hypothetical protein